MYSCTKCTLGSNIFDKVQKCPKIRECTEKLFEGKFDKLEKSLRGNLDENLEHLK